MAIVLFSCLNILVSRLTRISPGSTWHTCLTCPAHFTMLYVTIPSSVHSTRWRHLKNVCISEHACERACIVCYLRSVVFRQLLRTPGAAPNLGRPAHRDTGRDRVRLLRHRPVLGLQERGERLRLSGSLLLLQADVSDGRRRPQGRVVCSHRHNPRCRTARWCPHRQVSVILRISNCNLFC